MKEDIFELEKTQKYLQMKEDIKEINRLIWFEVGKFNFKYKGAHLGVNCNGGNTKEHLVIDIKKFKRDLEDFKPQL